MIFNRILYGHIGQDEFWDGLATCIEDAVLFAITNPIEIANSLNQLTTTLRSIDGYEVQFRGIYGKVTTAVVADSVGSFVRVLVAGPSAYDYHQAFELYRHDSPELLEEEPQLRRRHDETKAAMVAHPMSESAFRGAWVYFGNKAQCSVCHWLMTVSDNRFHNIGIGMTGDSTDLGRFLVTGEENDRGAFKTPPVRNVAQTAPYMHDGSLATLDGIVDWYAQGGHPNPQLSHRFETIELTDQDKADLFEFMRALTGPLPPVRTDRLPE